MGAPTDNEHHFDRVILLFLLALFLLLSPLVEWWAADESPWFAPYLIWGSIIGLTFWLQRRRARRNRDEL